ncbi:MAG: TadE/TadG family type IV pilus assembly protein [Pseudomonadota bacterium]
MTLKTLKRFSPKRLRGLRKAAKNTDGVSAVEFALVAPLMLLLFFGTTEVTILLQSERNVTSATSTMGDIAARLDVITDNDMEDIFGSTEIVLQTLDAQGAAMRISSLVADDDGNVTVDWSDGRNMPALSEGASVADLPENIVPANGSIIMSELEYAFQIDGYFLDEERQLSERFFLRPRRVDQIIRDREPQ